MSNGQSVNPRASDCYAKVLDAARDIDKNINGTTLARMPAGCARLIVDLKRWIQDGDKYALVDNIQAWPARDVMSKLVDAAEILMHQQNYDGHGHELITEAIERAKQMLGDEPTR